MPNVLENLHRNLTADGYQLGSLDDFKKAMTDSTKAANLYRNLSDDGYQLGSKEDFFKNVGNNSMQKPAQHAQQATAPAQKGTTRVTTPASPSPKQAANLSQETQKPTPLEIPQGFGEFDQNLANQMGAGLGPVSWERPHQVNPTTGKKEPLKEKNIAKTLDKAIKGDKQAAKESGLDAAAKRMQDELAYSEATGKALGEDKRYAQWEAPTLVKDENGQMLEGMSTDEQRAAQYQQQKREAVRKQIVNDAVDRLQKQMEADAIAKYGETQGNNGLTPEFQVGQAFGGYTQYLKNSSPEELLNRLNQTYGYNEEGNHAADFANRFLEDNRDAIEQAAAESGMTVEGFVYDEVLPQLANDIAQRFQQNMSEKYSVKDTADYLSREIGNSIIGTLATMGATTKKQRQYMQEELQKSREGEGAHYNASVGSRLAGEAMMFAADAAPIMVGAAAGGYTAKALGSGLKALGATELGALVGSGSPFLAANVGRLTKYAGLGVSGALRLAPFMGASSAVQDASVGDGTLSSIGRSFLEGYWEGAKFGGALGVLGAATGEMGANLSKRSSKAAFTAASFLAENQIIAGLDYIKDPENFNWRESSADAIYMMLASRLSSPHHIKETAAKFADMFKEGKRPQPIQLNDMDKEYIRQAFGGMDFVDIAADVNNIGKILNDKQAIPWTTRQKVSGYTTNSFESSRPFTESVMVMGNQIDERGKDHELIETHTFRNEDEKQQILTAIQDRLDYTQFQNDFGVLNIKGMRVAPTEQEINAAKAEVLAQHPDFDQKEVEPGGKSYDMVMDLAKDKINEARNIILQFAEDYGMTEEDVMKMMQKKPIERVEDEPELMEELGRRMHEAAYPEGELHTEQSRIDGVRMTHDSPVIDPQVATDLAQQVNQAKTDLDLFLNAHPTVKDGIDLFMANNKDARPDEIIMYVEQNFGGSDRDEAIPLLCRYYNLVAKRDGYIYQTGDNIDNFVTGEVERLGFKGMIDDAPDVENIITITKDGKRYTLLNGNIGTRVEPIGDGTIVVGERRMLDPDKSGQMIIAIDENGEFASFKPDAFMEIAELKPKQQFADERREQLQVEDTQTAIETGLVEQPKPEGEAKPSEKTGGIQDNAGGEAGPQEAGGNEPSATAISKIPTLKDEQGKDILDNENDPQYQWEKAPIEDTLAALEEISGGNRNTVTAIVDDMLNQSAKDIEKASKLTPKGKDPIKIARNAAEIKEQQAEAQRKLDYWTQVKQELEKVKEPETNLNVEPTENNQPENVVPLQPQAASEQQEEQNKPSLKSRLQKLAERYKKKFGEYFNDDIDVPSDATELVALNIGTGRQFRWDDKPDGKRGFKTALGIETEFGGRRGSEGHAFAHLFKGKDDTTGLGFDEFVDKVWRSDENTIHGLDGNDTKRFTEQQIGDAIIDLFMSAEQGKDITEYIIRNRVEKAQKGWEAEQARLKEEAERKEKIEYTDEELEKINKGLPFEKPTHEDIPDAPITKLEKEAKNLMQEEGTPEIVVYDTDRISKEGWRKLADKVYEGAFIGDEEVDALRERLSEGDVIYDQETGKIIVFSGKLTPEVLNEAIKYIKERIKDGSVKVEENPVGVLSSGHDEAGERRAGSEGINESQSEGRSESSGEPKRKSESSERDEYLKPRNEKEEKIVSDVEAKLAEDIKAKEDEIRKAKSELEKARANESDKATDLFANDKVFESEDQIFSSEEMGLDTSADGVEKRTKVQSDAVAAAEQELERLKSQAEHDSRVRGALDNERKQTSFEDPVQLIEDHAKEFQNEQDEAIGATRNETPEQVSETEGDVIINDEQPLTEEEIDNSSLSPAQKTWAKAYLRGLKDNELYTEAYLEAYEDVRNRRQDNEADRSDAGSGAQLAGSDDNQERGSGQPDKRVGELDSREDVPGQDLGGSESGGVQRVEDSTDNVPASAGESGDSGVRESESSVDGLPAGGRQPVGGSVSRSDGHHVRQPRGDKSSSRVAGETGERDVKTRRSELKSKRDELLSRLKALKEQEKKDNQGKLQMAILPPAPSGISSYIPKDKEQRKVFWELATTTAEYGYTYLEEGITKFKEWKDKVYEDFVEPIKDFFGWGQNEVDRYIEQVWNSDYEINGMTRTMAEWASMLEPKKLREVVAADRNTKYEQQKAAESVEVKTGDIDNIRESLPYLLPEQQDDVLKAETQFFDESHQDREHGNGKGMMFTNGTGTGKTYTGLGIVKRFVKQGKGRVLILTPSQEKVTDWRNDGRNLGLDIESLDEDAKNLGVSATKAKGKGVVVTTYANARQNLAMLEDCFDLIVYDESHKIMESKEATNTTMMDFHEMLTNKNVEKSIDRQTYWLPEWIEYRNLQKEREENREKLDILDQYADDETIKVQGEDVIAGELKSKLNARMMEIEKRFEELRPIMQEIRESKRPQAEIDSKRTKTVFLSATPFNVRESLRYAEGYLFSFPEEDPNTKGTYNHRSTEDAFLEQMFPAGYRWRYGRLESHVANAEALGRQEIDFSDYLQNTLGTMSGRMIASDYDYSRDFPVLTLDNAGRFNQAMSEVYRNKRYQPLAEIMQKIWNYNDATSLFEAMKTSLVNERIKEHLARGQKVVVFHRRRTSRDIALPFHRAMDMARIAASNENDGNTKQKLLQAVHDFEEDFRDIFDWEQTIDYTLPREQIERRFGKDRVAFFSGAETKKTKHQSVEEFMKDNGGKDIIVIQEASGKEGISLHDQTGEHQRVEINLALPQSPIAFIQIEGRIYRIGQKSNAIFEYPLLGLDLETNLFAQKFNNALGTTENLALGSKARNLRKSIQESVLTNTGEVDYDRQGLGGKDLDGRVSDTGDKDGFDMAIQDYYGNQKMKRGRDNREGIDYFPTPEPIGYKMVEFAQMLDGETALEPSAGHGAIARYVPETNGMTAIEPSASLFTKLQMRAGGPGRRFEEMTFEDYPLANKHDAILMNPPYGVGGKTAMEHVAKAFRHLNEGGRIVAIIPDGPAMEKRLDAWLNSRTYGETQGVDGAAVVVGEVKLPDVAFGRAGTSVRTRIVVIDKVSRQQMREKVPQKVTVDLSGEESIGGLFDRIRDVRMPERTIDQVAINTKKALRTKRALEDNPFLREFTITPGNALIVRSREPYSVSEIRMNLERPDMDDVLVWYQNLKKNMENPEQLEHGKYKNRSFGSGKNKVPALDAIKDYCQQAIKTLENVTGVTADQMDKMIRDAEAERERRRQEQEAKWERDRQERKRQEREKIEGVWRNIEEGFTGEGEYNNLDHIKQHAEMYHTRGVDWAVKRRSENYLRHAGFDPETGKKIDKNEPVNAQTATVVNPSQAEAIGKILDIANKGKNPQPTQRKADYEYKLDKNTKTGADMHLVSYNGARLSDADYRAVERKAKALGGYYNRFKKAFHFNTEEEAKKFAESLNTSGSGVRFSEKKNEEKLNNRGEDMESKKKDVSLPKNKIDYEETDRERVFAGDEAVMRTVAEAGDDGVRYSSAEEVGRGSGAKESVLRSLVQRAQENGTWRDSIDDEVTGYIGEGQENIVYLSKDGQHVIKLNNFKYVPDNASDLSAFVDRLRAHNELFPADAMELIGFTENAKGEVSAIIRQPFVDAEREATDAEIDQYLEDRDFTVDMTDEWSDGKYGVLDLKSDNVLVDKNGRLRFVDVIVRDMDRQKKRTRFKEGDGLTEQHNREVLNDAEKLAKKLGTPVKVATNIDEVNNKEAAEAIREGRKIQGWFDTKTGEITLYLPNIGSTHEGEKVVAHETIGHKGLRALLGEKGYKSYMRSLLFDLKNEELSKYIQEYLPKNGFDMYRTVDEFLAEAAEKGYGDLDMWQKVKESVTDALRKAGFTMSPSISDVKYMVWLSKHNLEKGNTMNQIEREALLYKLGKERYEAKVKNGEFTYADNNGEADAPYFPGEGTTLFRHAPSVKNQKRNYERALKRIGYVWKEAHVDAMQSAVELMRSISGVKKIEDIPAAENFVLLENQMSSKEEQVDYLFNRDYMEPLDKAVAKILPDMGKGVDEQLKNLQLYMIKKHGLERNRVLFVRDAIRALRKDSSADQQQVSDMEQDYYDTMRDLRDDLHNGNIDLREYFEEVDKWIKHNLPEYKVGEKDYSGLTSLYGKGYNEADVLDEVMDTEAMLGDERVNDLWDKTNAVSKFGLDMEYEGGIDSKDKHDKVSDMFEWYVPLRGYDEKTAEEVYDYLEEHGGNDRKWSGPVLMNAKGRESLADVDVFATLGAMSSNAINRSLRNQMKQAFARFVRNHYNDVDADNRLVTELPAVWAEKQFDPAGNEIWVEKFPDIPENAKADDIAAILDQYQQDMKAKEASGDAKRMRQNSSIPFRPASAEHKSHHIVDVWINGEKHAFIVNGNPRAAQAINGQLKAERRGNFAYMSDISHGIAKLATSYNPDFIISNAERDAIFSGTAIGIKESPKYFAHWVANYTGRGLGRVAAGVPLMKSNLFNRYRNNELNTSNPTDRYFKEFMENGGETGWVESKNLEKWKKLVKDNVNTIRNQVTKEDWESLKKGKLTASDMGRKLAQGGKDIFNLLPHAIEVMNERAENMARFATYMTSRQMGRSITRSVSDAKEVSVNFNRKGAGYKTRDMNKGGNALQKMNALVAARTAQYGQDYIMFYNAGVQGLNNASKLFRDHPIKASTAFTGFALSAFIMSWLNQSLIDSEDEKERGGIKNPYAELPEYVRRNNLCLYTGKGNFVYCALPIELRAMYGIGDMAAGYTEYPDLKSDKPIWQDVMTQLTQVLPIDFMGEHPGNPIINFMPSASRPVAEILTNQNWYGRPIEKEDYGNDSKPRHTRAYRSVNKAYMNLAKRWNAATNDYSEEELRKLGVDESMISDADANQKGLDGWLTDPSIAQHIVESYFGGLGKTAGNLAHVYRMAKEDDATLGDIISSDKTPILRKFHYSPTEQNKQARTRNKWFYYKDQLQDFNTQMKSLKEFGSKDPMSKLKEISEEDSIRATKMKIMADSVRAYNRQKRIHDNPKKDERQKEAAQMRMDQIMQNTVMALDSIR